MENPGRKTSDSFGIVSDFHVYCTPCGLEGKGTPAFWFCENCAEHLCNSCFNRHKREETGSQHTTLHMKNMPKSHHQSQVSVNLNIRNSNDVKEHCFKHGKAKITHYCDVHKTLLCSECVTREHSSNACYVIFIQDESYQLLNSKEYTDTLNSIDSITEKCKKIVADSKKTGASSNTFLKDAMREISAFRQEINSRLDDLEHEAMKAALSLISKSSYRMTEAKATCDEITESVRTAAELLKQHSQSKYTYKLFIELKSAQNLVKSHEKRLSEIESAHDKHYLFKPNPAILTLLKRETSLGTLETITPPAVTVAKSRQPQYLGNISVQSSADINRSWVTGMAPLFPNRLIIADKDNRSVKMVAIDKKILLNQMKLDASPWDVTPITVDLFAITLPFMQSIVTIRVNRNRFIQQKTLQMNGRCYGISFCQGKFVVSFQDPSKLEMIDMKGVVLKTVKSYSSGKDIFTHPNYLIANSSYIYVSDWKRHSIIRLNWQGEQTSSIEGIDCPQGIALKKDGSLFVSDYSDDKCNVYYLSSDLADGKVVLEDLSKPFSLCWCDTNRTLCISSGSGDEKNDNLIQIFKMP